MIFHQRSNTYRVQQNCDSSLFDSLLHVFMDFAASARFYAELLCGTQKKIKKVLTNLFERDSINSVAGEELPVEEKRTKINKKVLDKQRCLW